MVKQASTATGTTTMCSEIESELQDCLFDQCQKNAKRLFGIEVVATSDF
jgi:hypothetical protein